MPTVTIIGPTSEVSDATEAEAIRLAMGGTPTGGIGADLRVVELSVPAGNEGDVVVTVNSGDSSMLFMVQGGSPTATVAIDAVSGPGGLALSASWTGSACRA